MNDYDDDAGMEKQGTDLVQSVAVNAGIATDQVHVDSVEYDKKVSKCSGSKTEEVHTSKTS